jgi:adenine-specific DNA-methyltransferase
MNTIASPQTIIETTAQPGLVSFAELMASEHVFSTNTEKRKSKGQFFTPAQISSFMASYFDVNRDDIRLLDPGAGAGVLTAAFCEHLLTKAKAVRLTIDCYENDLDLLPLLDKTLEKCKTTLEAAGNAVDFHIHHNDFILMNIQYLRPLLFSESTELQYYDYVIANPPYYKLNKDSAQAKAMAEFVDGQPNIYALFMTLASVMTKTDGEVVFITPRSFCSGLYFKKVREWLLNNMEIKAIHIFNSRKEVFDNILQESIIVKAKKSLIQNQKQNITVTTSQTKNLDNLVTLEVSPKDVLHKSKRNSYIRIPTSNSDLGALHIVDKWPNTLNGLGFDISTGPIVPFRANEYLLHSLNDGKDGYPVIWMHNLRDLNVIWPLMKKGKAPRIAISKETGALMLPVKNYILVKRFSSKEQRRRLDAAVLLASEFDYDCIGLENHLNYIHKPFGNLSIDEAFGIAAILNTALLDNYFRALNGSTQVNATEIRDIPLPNIEKISEIGKLAFGNRFSKQRKDLEANIYKLLDLEICWEGCGNGQN